MRSHRKKTEYNVAASNIVTQEHSRRNEGAFFSGGGGGGGYNEDLHYTPHITPRRDLPFSQRQTDAGQPPGANRHSLYWPPSAAREERNRHTNELTAGLATGVITYVLWFLSVFSCPLNPILVPHNVSPPVGLSPLIHGRFRTPEALKGDIFERDKEGAETVAFEV